MSICRVIKKTNPYTSIHNSVFEDRLLPFECVGVLSYLLSKPNNWKVRVSDLVRLKCGRNKIYRILNDLIEAGYVVRHRITGEDGRVLDWRYDVYETCQKSTSRFSGSGQNFLPSPLTEKPDPGFRDVENRESSKDGGVVKTEGSNKGVYSPKSSLRRTSEFLSQGTGENGDGSRHPDGQGLGVQTTDPVTTGSAGAEQPGSEPVPGAVAVLDPGPIMLPVPGHQPDWCALIHQHDPVAAEMLATVFRDGVSPLTHPQVARKLYKRRQSGLTGRQIELLTRFYRKTYSEDPNPRWKVSSLFDLLSSAVLPDALKACQDAAREELEQLGYTLKSETDEYVAVFQMHFLRVNEVKTVEDLEKWLWSSTHTGETPEAAAGLLYLRGQYGVRAPEFRDKYRDAIRENIRHRCYLTMCDKHGIDPEELYGFTRAEIQAIQDEYWAPFHAKNQKIRSLI